MAVDNGDREIVKMLLDKNALGLELVIDKYSSMVYALIHRIMGKEARREDIEECTSDVFVDVWNSIEEFDEMRGTFKTWVLIKAKFKALDYRRKSTGDTWWKQNVTRWILKPKGFIGIKTR